MTYLAYVLCGHPYQDSHLIVVDLISIFEEVNLMFRRLVGGALFHRSELLQS